LKWKWANVPIPVQHLLGFVLGAIIQWVVKKKLFKATWPRLVIGTPLILIGVGLAGWSVLQAGETEVDEPNRLLTEGPYALSRNPMYVAWSFLYWGIGLVANSLWIVALFPVVANYTHFVDIRKEERFLEEKFGDEYVEYKRKVRRYL
jgi:protein-S-isoprenylcysteine O-methyltransferase Ste14